MRRLLVLAALLVVALPVGAGSLQLGLSFDGASIANSEALCGLGCRVPPDSMGAVGPDHVVVLVNGRYAVHRKSDGALLQTSGLTQFWGDAGVELGPSETYATYDPRVLYDTASQRCSRCSISTVAGSRRR